MLQGYTGRIANQGPQVVEAPHLKKGGDGKDRVHEGGDLRAAKSKNEGKNK